MKLICCLVSIIACLSIQEPLRAQTASPHSEAETSAANEKLRAIMKEIQQLHEQQKHTEALQKLDEADALSPNNPMLANVRGSIYTNMRDMAKARESFLKAQTLAPTAFEPRFNLAELVYVEQKYAEAEAAFTKILAEFPKMREEVRHLTQFKIIICQLKQNKSAEAEKNMAKFTPTNDTPAYFFSKAAAAFQKGDKADAQSWMTKAQGAFKAQQTAVYLDSLMEAHWITNQSAPAAAK